MNNNIISLETPQVKTWIEGTRKIYNDYMAANFPTNPLEVIDAREGQRYIKLVRTYKHREPLTGIEKAITSSVHAFLDRTNGDVLKPATFNAPAKGARGNVLQPDNGLKCMTQYGPCYMRDKFKMA